MCQVCVLWEKGKLTNDEALNALGELIVQEEDDKKSGEIFSHAMDVINRLGEEEHDDT